MYQSGKACATMLAKSPTYISWAAWLLQVPSTRSAKADCDAANLLIRDATEPSLY